MSDVDLVALARQGDPAAFGELVDRHRTGAQRRGEHAAMMDSVEAAGPTPEQAAVQRQLRRDIRDAICTLPSTLRDALLLAQSGDYSYEEIGAMLNSPVGTIKWRVSQARKVVRKQLHERGYGERE